LRYFISKNHLTHLVKKEKIPNFAPHLKTLFAMAVTRLKRKDRRNKAIATNKVNAIKHRTQTPEIKLVDIEAIKAEFAAKAAK
jgi:hypothetical protein